jgi:hypothetical protein
MQALSHGLPIAEAEITLCSPTANTPQAGTGTGAGILNEWDGLLGRKSQLKNVPNPLFVPKCLVIWHERRVGDG